MNKAALSFEHVSFSYPSSPLILDQLSLSVQKNEFVSILGTSGSGKSTLFRLITGLEQQTAGVIRFNGEETRNRHGKTGYMPQRDLLMPWRTVIENAVLPLELAGVSKKEAIARVKPLLQEFGLAGTENRYPGELSGGMRQRVSFLRSVLTGADVLLLDEPFSALDAITRLSMQEWLTAQWQKQPKTILFITHDVEEALFLSDRILLFNAAPVSRLQEVMVPAARPRELKSLHKPEMVALKEQLIESLRNGVAVR